MTRSELAEVFWPQGLPAACEVAQKHAREVHNMDGVTREQALAQAKPV